MAMRPLLRAAWADDGDGATDGQLLSQFVARRDEAAFAALVRRHGPMVLGVCRRVLGNAADAEDAFQATFLVVLHKARSLKGRAVLGDYLHGVARRIALKARAAAARRRARERALSGSVGNGVEERNDWLPLLDEELARLPEKYRLPIVLCDLEDRTRREVAALLGWPEGTIAGRLARGRALLAKRLLRGAQLHSGVLPGALAGVVGQAVLSQGLVRSTMQAAASVAAGKAAPAVVSSGAMTLAQGVLQTMLWNKLKIAVIVLLAAVCTAGVGGLTYRVVAGEGRERVAGNPAEAAGLGERPAELPQAKAADEKQKIVREIDIGGFRPAQPKDSARQQWVIREPNALATCIPDEEWQKKITKQVHFDKEQLLYFAWAGSPQDKLTFRVDKDEKGRLGVVFQYSLGVATYTVMHAKLFAVAKDVGPVDIRVEGSEPVRELVVPVREIDLTGFKGEQPKGSVYKPTEIANAKDLEQAIPNEDWRAKIAKQVDFAKEKLVFFAWSGQADDRLAFTTFKSGGPVVVFRYLQVLGDKPDVAHYRLYALAKEASWRVQDKGTNPPREEPPGPKKDDPTDKLLKDLDDKSEFVRAAAIDLLAERKVWKAIPKLIDLLADGTALPGSDHYVGMHAAAALQKITGGEFSTDQKKWKEWWAKAAKVESLPDAASDLKVLSAEATVELHGLLADTPKGVFLMVQEEQYVPTETGTIRKPGAVAWELDFGKNAQLARQAKELSGKAAGVVGTCKMVPAPARAGGGIVPIEGIGSDEVLGIRKGKPSDKWEIQRIVAVTKLSGGEK
jgi:RNA polymerase sigma factor (sigma-70 family)